MTDRFSSAEQRLRESSEGQARGTHDNFRMATYRLGLGLALDAAVSGQGNPAKLQLGSDFVGQPHGAS
eukprot:6086030-Alexandrium_andersonii.AAC.1